MSETQPYLAIIPCLNGGDLIGATIARTRAEGLPVLVVDDGSTDNTAEVAGAEATYLVRHERNHGKGRALRTGFQWSREHGFTAAVTLDADGQHDPASIRGLVETFERTGAAMVIGARFQKGPREPGTPWVRHVSNRVSSTLIRAVLGARVDDIQCGFRVYRLGAIESLRARHDGFAFETEIVALAVKRGLTIANHAIRCYYPDGTKRSHYRPLADSWEIAKVVCRARFGRNAWENADAQDPGRG